LKYRSRVDIVAAMLQSAIGGATKTKVMYAAFLSHTQVDEYLEFLIRKRLIAFIPDKKRYVTTARAARFLEMYDAIRESVAIEGTPGMTPGTPREPSVEVLDKAVRSQAEAAEGEGRGSGMDERKPLGEPNRST